MPIRIHNFAGKFGWNMRKYFPKLASEGYLTFQFMTRGKSQNEYIKYFMSSDPIPHPNVVNLETINPVSYTHLSRPERSRRRPGRRNLRF